jgi:Bax protein
MKHIDHKGWLQVSASIAILAGVVLVIFQLRQNADLPEPQIIKQDTDSSVLAIANSTVKPELPELPIFLKSPFSNITDHQKYSSAKEFESLLKTYNYQLEVVRKSQAVPQVFATNIPPHLASLPTEEKTSTFVRLLLPNVVKVNEDVESVRAELKTLESKSKGGEKLTAEESQWLATLGKDYGVSGAGFNELLARVDSVPVAMVLAQGIDESGWGTSRFAIQGNAFYGQHLSSKGGKFITSLSGNVKVAAFDDIYHSTASYIHNLNATHAYASFRDSRAKRRKENEKITGNQMVEALVDYSERGQEYVDDLKSIIRHHKLDSYDDVRLSKDQKPVLVKFTE